MSRMENNETTYTHLKKLSSKNGDIEYQAEVPAELVEQYVLQSLAAAAENFSLPGFRKGKVPHETVREHVGEMELLEDAAGDILREAMAEIIENENLEVIGRPQVTITKIAPQNPIEFRVRYSLSPDVSLPDYKKIGKQIFERQDAADVSDKEIDEAIERIQQMVGQVAKAGTAEAGAEQDAAPAPLTDEMVKQFGNFATVADFRKELKRSLEQEKIAQMKDGRRQEVVQEIVKHAKVKVPGMLVDQEFAAFIEERDSRLKAAGLSLEEYLKQTGKTAEQLDKEERALIENDLATSLTIQAIRKKENVVADERDVQILIMQLKARYPERTEAELRRTAEALILQDKVFAMLEGKPSEMETAKAAHAAAPAMATEESDPGEEAKDKGIDR
jgi:FKBP-type peptidyl-prolyl cis-trans isomerase (trigger factor)